MTDANQEGLPCPSNAPFKYMRQYPPLFFAVPTPSEQKLWNQSMHNTARAFHQLMKNPAVDLGTPLSNGATIGEYSMWMLMTHHQKRRWLAGDMFFLTDFFLAHFFLFSIKKLFCDSFEHGLNSFELALHLMQLRREPVCFAHPTHQFASQQNNTCHDKTTY